MAYRLGLAKPRKIDWTRTLQAAQPARALRRVGEIDTGLIGRADLEQQWLFEHQCTITCHRVRLALFIGGSGGPPARRIDGHWTTSFSAASSAAMSSVLAVSVTATTNPFCKASTPGYRRPSETPPRMPFSTSACTAGRASTGSFSVNSLKK